MSSDQIQPGRDFSRRWKNSPTGISGRAWVKRAFEFWHRCTIERCSDDGITVTLDDMDEFAVPHDHVSQFALAPGDLIFVQYWTRCISGFPGFVVRVNGEAAEVEFPASLYGSADRRWCYLRDIQFYGDLTPTEWKKGTSVFAYQAIQFNPPLPLLFPAIVQGVRFDVCVQVEFGNGESAHVPTTLVEKRLISPGDIVHTCTSYVSHGTNPDERWGPCRVLARDGTQLLLQDETGQQFEAPTSMVAVLPQGYRMIDRGRVETSLNDSEGGDGDSAVGPSPSNDVHVVRTDHWRDAFRDPITKADVDALIASDRELAWSSAGCADRRGGDRSADRGLTILWKGRPCFLWYRNEIRCAGPNEGQLAKMIEMAVELDANVIGDDGEEYH